MTTIGYSPASLLDDAIGLLHLSANRDAWFGPARNAYDSLIDEFRSRLIVLAVRVRVLE